jgi:DNA-binding protein Fis
MELGMEQKETEQITFDHTNLHEIEKAVIMAVMPNCDTIEEASKKLGITRHALVRRLTKYDLQRLKPEFRSRP